MAGDDGTITATPRRIGTKVICGGKDEHHSQQMLVGGDGEHKYSEFDFGAGEWMRNPNGYHHRVLPNSALILIEEIENGLHPVATRRFVEYLVDASRRKSVQVIFTTYSDFALDPLPPEGIWSCIEGSLMQGKLSVELLRAISGRVDKRLAVFVEDEFAKT